MAEYISKFTGEEIDAACGTVLDGDAPLVRVIDIAKLSKAQKAELYSDFRSQLYKEEDGVVAAIFLYYSPTNTDLVVSKVSISYDGTDVVAAETVVKTL